MIKPIFEVIDEAIIDGNLPDNYSLPDTYKRIDKGYRDGSLDIRALYESEYFDCRALLEINHFDIRGSYQFIHFDISQETKDCVITAIRLISSGDIEKADDFLRVFFNHNRFIYISRFWVQYIFEHQSQLDLEAFYQFGMEAMQKSGNIEIVKTGISLMHFFDFSETEKDIIRTLALCNEFTFYAVSVMSTWENGNDEIFEIAKKIHGWGQVHALLFLDPETEEIKSWILRDGMKHSILPVYSAWMCWLKSDAETVLYNNPTKEDLEGIGNILRGLFLAEDIGLGYTRIRNRKKVLSRYKKLARIYDIDLDGENGC